MAVPTTASGNISFTGTNGSPPYNGIWSIANAASPTATNESLRDLLAYDWFHGPNGGSTVSFNGWGEYTGTSGTAGDSRIYGIPVNSGNINYKMSDPAGLEYYYNGTTYKSVMNVNNSLGPGPPSPPNPPTNNDVNVNIYFGNYYGNFPYLSGGGPVSAFPPPTNATFNLDTAGSPLINNGFWYLTVSTAPNFGGTSANGFTMSINGNSIFAITLGAGFNNYSNNWTSFGTIQQMASFGGAIGFTVDINFN